VITSDRIDRHRSEKEFYDSYWQGRLVLTCDEKCRLRFILSSLKSCLKYDTKAAINFNPDSHVSPSGPRRIADVGCGRGWLTDFLSRFGETTGFDLSTIEARKRYPDRTFVECDILDLGKPASLNAREGSASWAEKFSVAVCSEVLEHVRVEDQPRLIESLASILHREGTLVLTTPNRPAISNLVKRLSLQHELQPVEDWLDVAALRNLVAPRFDILELTTVMFFPVAARRIGVFSRLYRALYEQLGGYKVLDPLLGSTLKGLYIALAARKRSD
jgi:2-polyprenyl-3-methyl-5-hydroxy-6-metoxy-1,4-benzoquinol methylase